MPNEVTSYILSNKSRTYQCDTVELPVLVLLWLLHQKGFFDPIYDWWEDHFQDNGQAARISHARQHRSIPRRHHTHHGKHHHKEGRHQKHERRHTHREQVHSDWDPDYYYYLHQVHKDKFKHKHRKSSGSMALNGLDDEIFEHQRQRRMRGPSEGPSSLTRLRKIDQI